MVRNGYILRDSEPIPIFDGTGGADSLLGFEPLNSSHVITDWLRFFVDSAVESTLAGNTIAPAPGTPAGDNGANKSADDAPSAARLQWAYRIDTVIVDPLTRLPALVAMDPPPSLLVRNLWGSAAFQLATGQDFERRLIATEKIKAGLIPKYLVTREELPQPNAAGEKQYRFVPVEQGMIQATPLWFYVLAEAHKRIVDRFYSVIFSESDLKLFALTTGAQLEPVGGRILLELFHGLLDSDPDSYRNHPNAQQWKSQLKHLRMWDIVTTP